MTKSEELRRRLGGEWTYDGHAAWVSEDGLRYVRRAPVQGPNAQGKLYTYHDGRTDRSFRFTGTGDKTITDLY